MNCFPRRRDRKQLYKYIQAGLSCRRRLKPYCKGSGLVDYDMPVAGTVEHDLLFRGYNVRLSETEIGNLLADSVAETSGAAVAVVNGGGIRGSLYQGEVCGEDLTQRRVPVTIL